MQYVTIRGIEVHPEVMAYSERLSDQHVFVSSLICNALFTEPTLRAMYQEGEDQLKRILASGDKYVTIAKPGASEPLSFFSSDVREAGHATGSLEGDALKIFEALEELGGKPAGFIWKPHVRYQAKHPKVDQLTCRLYDLQRETKFGPELSLGDYMDLLSLGDHIDRLEGGD